MKQRILIHMNIQKSSEYDIFNRTDYDELNLLINNKDNKSCPNFGNRLWFQGLISVIENDENVIEYYDYTMTKDYINSNYDMIIAPMANIFSLHFKDMLEPLADKFKDINIPVYVIACGVQANSYDDLDDLCRDLKEPATKFIKSVYKTGGEFALRGYFSKEFFDKLGFKSAVVTGCPSLYQLGRSLNICKKDIVGEELKCVINGNLRDYERLLGNKVNADFFDQHTFYHQIYDKTYFNNADSRAFIKALVKQENLQTADWLLKGKIKLIPNMNEWRCYLKQEAYNFSFGKRIHGNIMSILSGVPAVLDACDSRVREMGEFFEIPLLSSDDVKKYHSLYEIFEICDYSKFNEHFKDKYDAYEKFCIERGIVRELNSNNRFFVNQPEIVLNETNRKTLSELSDKLRKEYVCWKGYETLLKTVRKIRK